MKRNLLVLSFLAIVLMAAPLGATPTFTLGPSDLTASRFVTSGADYYGVHGSAAVQIYNPGLVGSALLADPTFLGFPDPGFTNSLLFALNTGPSEFTAIVFDLGTPAVDPVSLRLSALGVPIFPNPATDPALQALLGTLKFDFNLTSLTDNQDGTFTAQYALSGITAVPEPASISLLVVGLAAAGGVMGRRRLLHS